MFSPATIEAIGSYVYALADENDRIFYVGKGTGNRVFDHVDEVRRLLENDPDGLLLQAEADDDDDSVEQSGSRKVPKRQRIAEMLRANKRPKMYIIREGLTPEEAFLVEAALISVLDWQLDEGLSTMVAGHGTKQFGLKTVEELEATKGEPFRLADLPDLDESEEVITINVNQRWDEVVENRSSLLDISKGRWRLNKSRASQCRYAIVHAKGIVRGVFRIKGWVGPDADGRFSFEPADLDPLPGPAFSNKNVSSLFKDAASESRNPIRYVRLSRTTRTG